MTLVCICWFHVKIHRIWKVFYKKKMGVTQKTTQKGWLDEFHHCTYFNTFLFCCLVIFQVILITIDDPILWYRLFLRLLAVYPCHIHMFLPFRMAKQPTFFLVVSPIAQAAHRLDPRDPEGPPDIATSVAPAPKALDVLRLGRSEQIEQCWFIPLSLSFHEILVG